MKKMLALFCAFALVLSVFCACAKTDPDETVQGSTSQQSTAPEKSTDTDKNEALSTSEKDESKKDSTSRSTPVITYVATAALAICFIFDVTFPPKKIVLV